MPSSITPVLLKEAWRPCDADGVAAVGAAAADEEDGAVVDCWV